jgi:hypothetical protein
MAEGRNVLGRPVHWVIRAAVVGTIWWFAAAGALQLTTLDRTWGLAVGLGVLLVYYWSRATERISLGWRFLRGVLVAGLLFSASVGLLFWLGLEFDPIYAIVLTITASSAAAREFKRRPRPSTFYPRGATKPPSP